MTFVYIDWKLSKRLYSICVEQNTMLMCNLTDFFDWLDCSDLIICKHNRDQDCSWADSCFQIIQFYFSVFIYVQISNLKSTFFQIFSCMKDRMMLDLCCDNMISFISISFCSCF